MKDGLILEFDGVLLYGDSLSASAGVRLVNSFFDLSSSDKGKVLVVEKLSTVTVLKAEVVGTVAIITKNGPSDLNDGRIKISLPIISLLETDFNKLLSSNLEGVKKVSIDKDQDKLFLEV
jgi:hypothetical protein